MSAHTTQPERPSSRRAVGRSGGRKLGRLAVVGGGARSGKSRFALAKALSEPGPHHFVATAQAHDDEMRARIALHRQERAGLLVTHEAPLDLTAALGEVPVGAAVVVDCLTLWSSNCLLRGDDEVRVRGSLQDALEHGRARALRLWLVSNEVGMGIVPEAELGRRFRDLAGRLHQDLACQADELYLAALGCVLRLRPGPVELVEAASERLEHASSTGAEGEGEGPANEPSAVAREPGTA